MNIPTILYFLTSFHHFVWLYPLPISHTHLVADVIGFRLNSGAQRGDFDARHGRTQGLDTFLDGVRHQLVAGFREGHLCQKDSKGSKLVTKK